MTEVVWELTQPGWCRISIALVRYWSASRCCVRKRRSTSKVNLLVSFGHCSKLSRVTEHTFERFLCVASKQYKMFGTMSWVYANPMIEGLGSYLKYLNWAVLRRFRFSLCFVNVFCHILHAFFTLFLFAFRTVYICVILSCPFSFSLSFMFCWFPELDFQHLVSRLVYRLLVFSS